MTLSLLWGSRDLGSYFSLSLSLAIQSGDTTGYDDYVEGVEPDETTSLETHIAEVGVAF